MHHQVGDVIARRATAVAHPRRLDCQRASSPGPAALARILLDPPFRSALGRSGRKRVESHYTWERVAERTEGIYERALDRSARALSRLAGVAS